MPELGTLNSSECSTENNWVAPSTEDDSNAPSIDYPAILFLDPSLAKRGQFETDRTITAVKPELLNFLGSMQDIQTIGHEYFSCIHNWLPFMSKKRFYDVHLRLSFYARPEVALLFLAMKLITSMPLGNCRNFRTPLYQSIKHFYLEVESSSSLSILVLQAAILISLYELGHGIYPAAYLSIGSCARYGYAIGISVRSPNIARKPLSFLEVEEQRRAWWAVVILDRSVILFS